MLCWNIKIYDGVFVGNGIIGLGIKMKALNSTYNNYNNYIYI